MKIANSSLSLQVNLQRFPDATQCTSYSHLYNTHKKYFKSFLLAHVFYTKPRLHTEKCISVSSQIKHDIPNFSYNFQFVLSATRFSSVATGKLWIYTREIDSEFCYIKQNLDCNLDFPMIYNVNNIYIYIYTFWW